MAAVLTKIGMCLRAVVRVARIAGSNTASGLVWEIPANKYERWGLYTQSSFVVVVYGFMKLRPAFTGHSVATGYMIAALALAAVVMAARADSLTATEKIVWIAICAGLFIWELQVIDDDHAELERQHHSDIAQQSSQFATVLSDNQHTFNATMKELSADEKSQQDEFKATMDKFSSDELVRQQQFDATMRAFSSTESANQTRFDKLIDHEEQLAESLNGSLIPSNEPTPQTTCGPPPTDGAILFLGDESQHNGAVIRAFPHVVLALERQDKTLLPIVSLDRDSSGILTVLLDIRSQDGRIIARMNHDGFVVNRNNYLEMKKDKSSLEIIDEYGNEVLKVHYINPHAINVGGANIGLPPLMSNICSRGSTYDFVVRPQPQ